MENSPALRQQCEIGPNRTSPSMGGGDGNSSEARQPGTAKPIPILLMKNINTQLRMKIVCDEQAFGLNSTRETGKITIRLVGAGIRTTSCRPLIKQLFANDHPVDSSNDDVKSIGKSRSNDRRATLKIAMVYWVKQKADFINFFSRINWEVEEKQLQIVQITVRQLQTVTPNIFMIPHLLRQY
ncbi:unnamed protein product [Haemonchus placei]|uniref:Uncharacterized protein n=1 Tax=Haemonchus placei TaxID=6290 RepID=A0A0N4WJ79_HAEPC|nr:unnamed protein product [Haemonchus placei]